jgi:hypothetical protein
MSNLIPLTRGLFATVDDWNFQWLNQFKWHAYRSRKNGKWTWYAGRKVRLNDKSATQAMHRIIMGVTDSKIEVDHRDHDGLSNIESNLRLATFAENAYNTGASKRNTSGYKGASWDKSRGKWTAHISFNGKQINLGRFGTAIEAAAVYNFAARRLHGEFAVLNDLSK